jgi:hypothetical protein
VAHTDEDQELLELQRALSASGAAPAGLPSGAAVAADPEVIRTWELRQAAQREAYGQFVADGDVWIGNCMTFTGGQPVPLEHVIRFQLDERHQVNRVATPEMARVGKVFETDDEFLDANPHVRARLQAPKVGDLHPSALDPRGGGAAIDEARKAGKPVPAPTFPGDTSPERAEAVSAAAESLPPETETGTGTGNDDEASKGSGSRSGGKRVSGGQQKAKED